MVADNSFVERGTDDASGHLNSKHNFLNIWDEYLESGVDNASIVVSVQIGRFGIDLGIAIHPSLMLSG